MFLLKATSMQIPGYENYTISEEGIVVNTNTGRVLKPSLNENGYLYISLWKNNRNCSRTVHRLVALTYIPNPDNKPFVNHIDANRSNPRRDNLEWCTQTENIKHAYMIGNMSQKQNFTVDELEWLLTEFLQNRTMTELATQMHVGLSRLTINLRKCARQTNRLEVFEAMLTQQKRVRNTEANVSRQKPIIQLDRLGRSIATFPSLTTATRALGKSSSGPISNALNPDNPQRTAYGFQWKFA